MNNQSPFLAYVNLLESARAQAALIRPVAQHTEIPSTNLGTVLVFSPHPDDESIVGGLALRLLGAGYKVINVAVTLGSNVSQRPRRRQELTAACRYLGFDFTLIGRDEVGLDGVTLNGRTEWPEAWAVKVAVITKLFRDHAPTAIFYPHPNDYNGTHVGTSYLVTDALESAGVSCHCFQTEYWQPMDGCAGADRPNLLVEISTDDVATMMNAIALHEGEVARNPYHLTLPFWLADNVRRGAEIVGVQGAAAPKFSYGTIYRHGQWAGGQFVPRRSRFLSLADDPTSLFSEESAK